VSLIHNNNNNIKTIIQYCDVTDITQCINVIKTCEKEFSGRIDLLVLNAIYQGPGAHQRIDQLEIKEYMQLFQGNVLGQFAMIREILPIYKKQKSGCIITLVSGSSWTKPTRPVDKGGFMTFGYVSTKTAIAKLIPILAVEMQNDYPNCRFFNIDPGLIITEAMKVRGTAEKFKKWGVNSSAIVGEAVRLLVTAPYEDEYVKNQCHGKEFITAMDVVKKFKGDDGLLELGNNNDLTEQQPTDSKSRRDSSSSNNKL
jgi:NADP-dependent 3-hydroxy acid dehydrogenase YdfG